MNNEPWIGVDLDGTLARYDGWDSDDPLYIGDPVPAMVARVLGWLAEGKVVKIFTARVSPAAVEMNNIPLERVKDSIEDWCAQHLGVVLEVTCIKDPFMIELWDDRVVQVIPNVGEPV